jgi:hypothetical protein
MIAVCTVPSSGYRHPVIIENNRGKKEKQSIIIEK